MDTGDTERLPANIQILIASIIFTIISYAVFTVLLGIRIPFLYFLAVLALQTATVLLGNRGILTSMGAASVAVLLAIAAYFAAVLLLAPSAPITRIVGIVCGAAAAFFVLTSTITSFRAGTLDLEVIDAMKIDDEGNGNSHDYIEEVGNQPDHPTPEEDLVEQALEEILLDDPIDLTEGTEALKNAGGPDPDGLTASQRVGGSSGDVSDPAVSEMDISGSDGPIEELEEEPAPPPESSGQFQLRCRYRVIEAASGNPLGTFYSDEGYSSLDPAKLGVLLREKTGPGELRIVNLDWSNFDEVEIQVETIQPPNAAAGEQAVTASDPGEAETPEPGGMADTGESLQPEPELPEGVIELDSHSVESPAAGRYIIYERRTMRPLGEYVPEGDRPRLDRLTLYRMFPDYDFKTFQIDSIRWLEGEVGIFIKGDKKKDEEEKQEY
jgi:hypothetical protein